MSATVTTPAFASTRLAPSVPVRLHVGLYVADLDRAVCFFRVLLNAEPKKHYPDHAHFESDEPAVVLALSPGARRPGGTLNHIGIRLTTPEALVAVQRRLEQAGYQTQRQEGVACCYAWQTKFWVTDPDYNLWEIYILQHDLNRHGFEEPPQVEPLPAEPRDVVWEHRGSESPPERIDHADSAVDEVRLLNSYNGDLTQTQRANLLAEVRRVLRPGGRLVVTGLVGDRPVADPNLPGLASRMRRVPVETEPLEELHRAGFVDLFCEELADIHCFQIEGVELRKLRLHATQPAGPAGAVEVLYRGPFREVKDDEGRVYPRGCRVAVPAAAWERLRQGPAAGQFQFFPEGANSPG